MIKKYINILLNSRIFRIIPDKTYLKIKFRIKFNRKLNLKQPQTFNEKLQWLKLYDRNSEYTKMVDKYEAKKYVENIIGKEYIIPTLAIYDKFDDIEWDKLPNEFVIKCTHDSGGLVICKDKTKLDIKSAKKKINKCLHRNFYYLGREWVYKNLKAKILIEKYMGTQDQEELVDYKFFCLNGEPKFLYISEGLENHATAKMSFVDMEYNMEKFHRKDYKTFEKLPAKPINFEKMKKLAKILSKDIPFLRVDFYEIEGKIYFGELTFFPCSGYMPFKPEKYDKILGDMLELPKEKRE